MIYFLYVCFILYTYMYICGTHVFRWLCVPKDIALAFPNQPRAAVGEVVTKVPAGSKNRGGTKGR